MRVSRLLFSELKIRPLCFLVMGDLRRSLSSSSSTNSSASFDLHPLSIDSELWLLAEERTQEILSTIQPALASEQKRKEVIDYIQSLIKGYFATEVFPFGSVPLKTYLPDGDIDLTALGLQNMEENLAREVCNILKCVEENTAFQVKDVQYIQARVKIVKCCVKNISVDISFNQMTGLRALWFLEQVDKYIGKDHLFKRSIILIKAWCFYESRILGAHHGLISTYALEMLVLYIINFFHSSLPGPLAVLYRFLDYYSAFDWENYCVSINGPIAISSLSEIPELPENNGNKLLLSNEFLRKCREMYSVPIETLENESHGFLIKHLNIVDPLKKSNNLGRSVNKGNFHRIKCALSFGAQRLEKILMLPGQDMGVGLEKFFKSTLDQNGKGQRPDAQVPVPAFGTGASEVSDLSGDSDMYYSSLSHGLWYHNFALPILPHPSPPSTPPSQIQQKNAPSKMMQCKKNIAAKRGTDVFFPKVPPCRACYSPLYPATSGIDEMVKSRGTGTYIPDMTCNPYRDLLSWKKGSDRDSWIHDGPSKKSFQRSDWVEGPPQPDKNGSNSCLQLSVHQFAGETEKTHNDNNCFDLSLDQFPILLCSKNPLSSESHQFAREAEKSPRDENCFDLSLDQFPILRCSKNPMSSESHQFAREAEKSPRDDTCFNLSLDQFPHLPCSKNSMPSEKHQSHPRVMKSGQAKECSASLDDIQFGIFRCSLSSLGLPPSQARKQAGAGASTTLKTMPVVPKMGMHKQ